MTKQPGQEPVPNPGPSVEQKNRIILLLLFVFLITLFMDYQARRHYRSMSPKAGQEKAASLDEEIEEAKKKLDQELKRRKNGSTAPQPIPGSAESILGTWSTIKKQVGVAVQAQTATELQQLQATQSNASAILTKFEKKGNAFNTPSSPADQILHKQQHYFLYFIRFDGKKSKIVRVRRKHNGGPLRLSKVLAALRKGPKPQEKSLLNNFDHRVKVRSVRISNGTATVDLNPAIGRMGPHVIHDRLEQLAHCLTQFHQVDRVKLLIEGKAPSHIGEQRVSLPPSLRPTRPSVTLKR